MEVVNMMTKTSIRNRTFRLESITQVLKQTATAFCYLFYFSFQLFADRKMKKKYINIWAEIKKIKTSFYFIIITVL